MIQLPNLAGIATADLVEKIGGGNFSASYINWSRTLHLLREHAPGWLPELVPTTAGDILHSAPVGCYLMIRFRKDDITTPPVPQAVMDTRNAAIPRDKITARDVTDTHRRGVCMAAAMTFGLAYELWAKLPLESGYEPPEPEAPKIDRTLVMKVRNAISEHVAEQRDLGVKQEWDAAKDLGEEFATAVWSGLPTPDRDYIRTLYPTTTTKRIKEAA
jgi:hypothetical protein